MEPVKPLAEVLPGFSELPTPRDGFQMTFRGQVPDADGSPEGDYVEVELIVPPLNLHSIQVMQRRQKARSEPTTPEQMHEDGVETIFLALKRNYRGVPRWLIEQSLDSGLMEAIMAKFRDMARETKEKKTPE